MKKDIMLCFLSDVKRSREGGISVAEYQNIGAKKDCHTTNESAIRYLLCGGHAQVDSLSHLFLVRTQMVAGPIAGYEDAEGRGWTHYGYFLHRISDIVPNVEDIAESIDFDEQAPIEENMDTLIEVASSVRRYAQDVRRDDPTAEIVLHVDCTGGLRNASMILIALMRLVQYERIAIGKVIYSNYHAHRVEEVKPLYAFFDLVAGAEEFVRHGEVSVLRDYFRAREKSPALERLLAAMHGFAEELTLCHYGELRTAIDELRRRIEAFPDESSASISAEAVQSDNLMRQMLVRIREDYSTILTEEVDDIALIGWCIDRGFLQQSITFFTERVPELLVNSGFLCLKPEHQENFLACLEKDPMHRNAGFYLVNEYRGEKLPSEEFHKVQTAWRDARRKFLCAFRAETTADEIFAFADGAMRNTPQFRLGDAQRMCDVFMWLSQMLREEDNLALRDVPIGKAFLGRVRTPYINARRPKKSKTGQGNAEQSEVWDALMAQNNRSVVMKLGKFLGKNALETDLDQIFSDIAWMPVVRRMGEGGFTVRDNALAERILRQYFAVKDERNHTSHARAETGRPGIEELTALMRSALADIRRACKGEDCGNA